jgi:hypothetical protein
MRRQSALIIVSEAHEVEKQYPAPIQIRDCGVWVYFDVREAQ